jgi:hypothetical protein
MSKSPQSTLHPREARGSHRGHYLVCVGGCCFHVSPAGLQLTIYIVSDPAAQSLTNGKYQEEGTSASDSSEQVGARAWHLCGQTREEEGDTSRLFCFGASAYLGLFLK